MSLPSLLLPALLASSPAQAGIGGVAITIQADPHEGPADHWNDLVAAVRTATSHGHRLTILLAPNWAQYIKSRTTAKATVAAWINDNGHQVGFHHHDVTHINPAGYCGVDETDWNFTWTSSSWAAACEPYFDETVGGDAVADLAAILYAAPYNVPEGLHSSLNIACHGTEQDMRTLEWQPGMIFSQGKQGNGSNDPSINGSNTLTGTSCQSYAGTSVPEIGSKWFFPPAGTVTADEIIDDIRNPYASASDYVSITFHPQEFAGGLRNQYVKVFSATQGLVGSTMLMSEILVQEDPCGQFADTGL